ncbi:very short patch repair endonuclease [Variovorax atrisoli]|uniref:very short patch repair endonuclease n=1 Tax=Variovorax atrisoli TaxID=3394203 RepID=UPI0033964362
MPCRKIPIPTSALSLESLVVSKPDLTRSATMRAVRGQGNKSTEAVVAKLLAKAKLLGWRRHLPLPGTPDFAWPGLKVAVFVDGCFWHGCPRCNRPLPKTNSAFWAAKVARNQRRDRASARRLRALGWSVLRVWEHALSNPQRVLARIKRALARNEAK